MISRVSEQKREDTLALLEGRKETYSPVDAEIIEHWTGNERSVGRNGGGDQLKSIAGP